MKTGLWDFGSNNIISYMMRIGGKMHCKVTRHFSLEIKLKMVFAKEHETKRSLHNRWLQEQFINRTF